MEPSSSGEYIVSAYKAAPPVAVTTFTLSGVTLNQWVLVATLVYTLLQTGYFIYDKFIRKAKV